MKHWIEIKKETKVLKKYVAELKEDQVALSKLDEEILDFFITEEVEVCEK